MCEGERTPEGAIAWAKEGGPHLLRFVRHQVERSQPFLSLSACDQLRSLARKHGTAVLDRAARAALDLRSICARRASPRSNA